MIDYGQKSSKRIFPIIQAFAEEKVIECRTKLNRFKVIGNKFDI